VHMLCVRGVCGAGPEQRAALDDPVSFSLFFKRKRDGPKKKLEQVLKIKV